MPAMDTMRAPIDILDTAGKMLEKYLAMDSNFPTLVDVTQIAPQGMFLTFPGENLLGTLLGLKIGLPLIAAVLPVIEITSGVLKKFRDSNNSLSY